MKKIGLLILFIIFLFWFFFKNVWLAGPGNDFKYSDRDKTTVFPVSAPATVDPFSPTPTQTQDSPTLEIKSSTDTSVIKF